MVELLTDILHQDKVQRSLVLESAVEVHRYSWSVLPLQLIACADPAGEMEWDIAYMYM